METPLDQYTGADNIPQFLYGTAFNGSSQSFTPSVTAPVSSASMRLMRVGNPGGNITIGIAAHSGTYGTSSVPGSVIVSKSVAASTVSTTKGMFNVQFDTNPVLNSGTRYVVYITYTGGDASNYVAVYANQAAPDVVNAEHPGNAALYISGSWSAVYRADAPFYVYGIVWLGVDDISVSTTELTNQVTHPGVKIYDGTNWKPAIAASTTGSGFKFNPLLTRDSTDWK